MKKYTKHVLFIFRALTVALIFFPLTLPAGTPIPIIDVHSQVDHNTDIEKVVPLMDKAGVAITILSTRFQRSSKDVVDYAKKHPDRIIPAFKTKTKSFMKGKADYKKLMHREDQSYTFGAMAEVILYHAQKGNKAGQAVIWPDAPQAMDLLAIAKKHGWPYIFHIEFASAGSKRKRFMQTMEKVVSDNPKHYFGVIHMGQLDQVEVERLVRTHSNLFFIMSHSNPVSVKNTRQPWINMFKGQYLKPVWEKLIVQYPKQFVIGFDNVFPMHWGKPYLEAAAYWRSAMSRLPDDVAHAVAHKNAEQLWHIKPLH